MGPAGALLGGRGPLVNVGAPEICQDVVSIVLQINTAAADTHSIFTDLTQV